MTEHESQYYDAQILYKYNFDAKDPFQKWILTNIRAQELVLPKKTANFVKSIKNDNQREMQIYRLSAYVHWLQTAVASYYLKFLPNFYQRVEDKNLPQTALEIRGITSKALAGLFGETGDMDSYYNWAKLAISHCWSDATPPHEYLTFDNQRLKAVTDQYIPDGFVSYTELESLAFFTTALLITDQLRFTIARLICGPEHTELAYKAFNNNPIWLTATPQASIHMLDCLMNLDITLFGEEDHNLHKSAFTANSWCENIIDIWRADVNKMIPEEEEN